MQDCYLIIGNGRVATHFKHYFSLLGFNYLHWNRREHNEYDLRQKLNKITHVLLLIKDDAIENFFKVYLQQTNCIVIHFSGSLVNDKIYGVHPLYCFNNATYHLEQYLTIPFIVDNDEPFTKLLPGLPNVSCYLKPEFKKKYHALCVLAGNFSCILWQKLITEFKQRFSLPERIAFPFLMQQTNNLIQEHGNALTGPLSRGDQKTITENIQALEGDAFQTIYQSFVTCFQDLSANNLKGKKT